MNTNQEQHILGNILVVDDRPENLRVLTQVLEKKGYKVRKAINGETALISAKYRPPDLILLDIIMPDMDGYQVCKQLKEYPRTCEIPIIFVSALDEVLDKVKAFNLGCVDYITKPFQVQELLIRVQTQLKLQQQKQQLEAQNQQLKKEIYDRQLVEENLRLLDKAISACSNGIIITNATEPNNPIIYANPAFETISGYSVEEVLGKNWSFLLDEDDSHPDFKVLEREMIQGKGCQLTMRNYRKDGTLFWNEIWISAVANSSGVISNYISIQTDITDRKQMQEALQSSEERFASAFIASPDPITIITLEDERYLEVNDSFCRLMGYREAEVINQTTEKLNIWVNKQRRHTLVERLKLTGSVRDLEIEFRTKSGKIRTMLISAELIKISEEDCILTVGKDITDRKQIQLALEKANQKLHRLANSDGLTQVANRRYFDEILSKEWRRCMREKQPLSLILCDVDYFKFYNDYYGHQMGDDCLIKVAQAMSDTIRRPADIVARYGGEEFVVILPNTDKQGAINIAESIQEKVSELQIMHLKSKINQYITLSFGCATVVPDIKFTPKNLIHTADEALYTAKNLGRNRIISKILSENKT
ncbi:MAG: diguanylate cyclase [Microcoleaceae cyanobacterium]